tara:strand:+ start:483 stop:638 length:156 start_codon:yes stop_codon:yes gene_type:complete
MLNNQPLIEKLVKRGSIMINSDSKTVKSKIQKIDKEIDKLLDNKAKELQEP